MCESPRTMAFFEASGPEAHLKKVFRDSQQGYVYRYSVIYRFSFGQGPRKNKQWQKHIWVILQKAGYFEKKYF